MSLFSCYFQSGYLIFNIISSVCFSFFLLGCSIIFHFDFLLDLVRLTAADTQLRC